MRIVMIAPEAVPFAKTGGLADVVGALAPALASLGHEVSIFMPFYSRMIDPGEFGIEPAPPPAGEIEIRIGANPTRGRLLTCRLNGDVRVYFISQPTFFDREELYQTTAGDYPDNAARFAFFSRAAVESMIALGMSPDIVQVHDWQASLVPVYLKTLFREAAAFRNTKTLLTIHNLGYQGLFPKEEFALTGLGPELFTMDKLEYWGMMNVLKGGIAFADAINTVSSKYAQEIMTHEMGMGLDAALAQRRDVLTGILNGIDYSAWDPASDSLLPANFGHMGMEGKEICRKELRREFKLPGSKSPLIGMVGRLTVQKGLDILAGSMVELMERDLQLVILGTGEEKYHLMLQEFAKKYPSRVGVKLAFDNRLAHLIEAGTDMFLMPSYYEPCGLNQMISLRYGTIPIVRATGGLDDTIEEFDPKTGGGNGFKFKDYSPAALCKAVDRALKTHSKPRQWSKLISNAMECDFSWERSAGEYVELYGRMLGKGKPGPA